MEKMVDAVVLQVMEKIKHVKQDLSKFQKSIFIIQENVSLDWLMKI